MIRKEKERLNNRNMRLGGGVQRDPRIDCLKGLAITLVVWGHFIEHTRTGDYNYYLDPVHIFIFSFHMPLFAAISGYLSCYSLKRRDTREYLVTIARSYLYPVVVWSIISLIIRFIGDKFFAHKIVSYSIYTVVSTIFGNGFWFLWSIFGCAFCVLIIEKSRLFKYKGILFCFVWLILYLLPNSERSLFLYPFFIVGFLVAKYSLNTKPWYRKVQLVLFIAFILLIWFYTEDCYVYVTGTTPGRSKLPILTQIGIVFFRWIIGFGGIAFINLLLDFVLGVKRAMYMNDILCNLGRFTLEIYVTQAIAVNYVFVMAVNKLSWMGFLSRGILDSTFMYDFVTTPILTVIFIAVDVWLIKLIKKTHLFSVVLFGR